ncbi:hypothetical protein [Mycobacteroides abscessus]|uniref:hypothetical protein n=1 Tax=Mycobacteroides abscessus TaxID=36809 RepID=UPI000C26732C|nr:hypothetical protein [Mycobacteroides abscessus]
MSYKFNIEVFDMDRLADYPGQQPVSIQNTENSSVCALNFQQNLMVTYAAPDAGGSLQAHQFFYDPNGKQNPVGPLTNYGKRTEGAIFCQFVHKGKHYTVCTRRGSTSSVSMDLWRTDPRANGAEKMGVIETSNVEGTFNGVASVDLNGTVFLFERAMANFESRIYVRTSHNAVGEKGEPTFGKEAQMLVDKVDGGAGISVAALNGKIYLVYSRGDRQTMSVYDGVEWRTPEEIVPAGGAALGAEWVGSNVTVLGNRLYYFGYQKCQNIPGPLLSSISYDPATQKWGAVTPPAREHLASEVGYAAPHMNTLKLLRPFNAR